LLGVFGGCPAELFSLVADGVRCIEEDQDVGAGDQLPHLGDKGVFLHDLAGVNAALLETARQSGLAGAAWPHNGDPGIAEGLLSPQSDRLLRDERV
jgi:hypothetical protein